MDEFADILIDVLKAETSEVKLIEQLKSRNPRLSTSYIKQSLKRVEEVGLISSFKHRNGQTCWNFADDNIDVNEDSEPSSENVTLISGLSSTLENTHLQAHANSSVCSSQSISQHFDPDETALKERTSNEYTIPSSSLPQALEDSRRHRDSRVKGDDETPLKERARKYGNSSSSSSPYEISRRDGNRTTVSDETPLKERARKYGNSSSSPYEISRQDGNRTTVRAGDLTVQTNAPVTESRATVMEPDLEEYYNYLQRILKVLQKSNLSLAGKDIAQKSGTGKSKSDVNKVLYFLEKRNVVEKEKSGKPMWRIPNGKVVREKDLTKLATEWKGEVLKSSPKKQVTACSSGSGMELMLPGCGSSALVTSQVVQQYEEHMDKILSLLRSSAAIASCEIVSQCDLGSKMMANSYLYFMQSHGLICKEGANHWKLLDSCSQDTDTHKLAIEMAKAKAQSPHRASENSGGNLGNNTTVHNHYHHQTVHNHFHQHNHQTNVYVQVGKDNTMCTPDLSSGAVANPDSTQS